MVWCLIKHGDNITWHLTNCESHGAAFFLISQELFRYFRNFQNFLGSLIFIGVFTRFRHRSLPWARWIQSTFSHPSLWVTGLFTGNCHLKGRFFKSHLRKVPGRISLTYPMWLLDYSILKFSSRGTLLHGTRWLLRRPFVYDTALHSRGRHSRSLMIVVHGPVKPKPLFIHFSRTQPHGVHLARLLSDLLRWICQPLELCAFYKLFVVHFCIQKCKTIVKGKGKAIPVTGRGGP
jgi:hypothetical protein